MNSKLSADQHPPIDPVVRAKARRTLILVFLTCAVPILLAAYFYFIDKPQDTNNYGTLLNPQTDVSTESFKLLSGEPLTMSQFKGKWVVVQIMSSQCDQVCQNAMFYQRQARLSKGKDMYRLERVAFVIDDGPLETQLLKVFDDVHFVRANPEQLKAWLPLNQGLVGKKGSAEVGQLQDHLFVVDPLGHVMMRFPKNDSLDFQSFRKDISRLLWASNIG